jgi:alkylhydroperoxidase/carboxymuconolactone decarboxylase family protein YurZ
MNNGGCSCGGESTRQSTGTEATGTEVKDPKIRPGLIDRNVTLLISAGAAMAGNCEPCLRKIVADLKEADVTTERIQGAVLIGQIVKEKPASNMKEVADSITGTRLTEEVDAGTCPADSMAKDENFKITMLIAAGAAMAANCEFCLNKVVPDLIEAGVSETDIRRAVEIGQFVKDQPAAIMKEAADILTGSNLSEGAVASEDCPGEGVKQDAGCCG